MVSFNKLCSLVLISSAALVSAATYHIDVDYEEYLDVYFHYRESGDAVTVEADATGLTINVDSNSVIASDCQILQSGMLVYTKDGSSDRTLVTWDQYEVFHLTYDGSEITYNAVNPQSCGPISSVSSTTVITANDDIPTKDVPVDQITYSASLTESVPSTTVVTTTVSGVVTSYTSYCPISTIYGNSVVTVTENDVVTSYTTYCPVSEVVLTTQPKTVTKTITSCDNNACTATTSELTTGETITVTKSIQTDVITNTKANSGTVTKSIETVPTTSAKANSEIVTKGVKTEAATSTKGDTVIVTKTTGNTQGQTETRKQTQTPITTSATYAPTDKVTTVLSASSTDSVHVYEGEANFFSVNKLAIGILAVGAAMI